MKQSGGRDAVAVAVLAVQRGEPDALERLVRMVQPRLLALAGSILGDPVAAEDVFIEAMDSILRKLPQLEEPAAFARYARRAVRNAAIDLMRARHHRDSRRALQDTQALAGNDHDGPPMAERMADRGFDPERAVAQQRRHQAVHLAVAELKEPRRTVVRRFYLEGRTYQEIADELGMSSATVKRHLGSARAVLAARLSASGGEHAA